MTVHCPFCDDDVEPNPNSIHCPDCGNPIPELKDRENSKAPPGGVSGEANVSGKPPAENADSAGSEGSPEPEMDKSPRSDSDESTCPSCGEPVEDDWDACPFCTTDLGKSEPAEPSPDSCPECGYEPIAARMNICPKCKTSLPGEGSAPAGQSEPAHPAESGEAKSEDFVVLSFDAGGSMEVNHGTTLGTELRQHLHDNGVPTEDAMRISRQHLKFKETPAGFQIVDLESTNGTELNGEKLEPNREYDIADGDRLKLGGTTEVTVQIP